MWSECDKSSLNILIVMFEKILEYGLIGTLVIASLRYTAKS